MQTSESRSRQRKWKQVNPYSIFCDGLSSLCKESTYVLNSRYVILAGEFGKVQHFVPIWQRYTNEHLMVRVPIHVHLVLRIQPEMILNHISYPSSLVFILHHRLRDRRCWDWNWHLSSSLKRTLIPSVI
jgi:hypothetical protein